MLNETDLHPYQCAAVEHILQHSHCALFLEMGLGKSISVLTAITRLRRQAPVRVLVIAPKRVAQTTWTDEIRKWEHTRDLKTSVMIGSVKERREAMIREADIYLINRENVSWLIGELRGRIPYDMLVIDELSSFKNPGSQRFKALKRVRHLFSRVVGLTGTPAPNGYPDLWAPLYLLDGGERLGRTVTWYRETFFYPAAKNGYVVYRWNLKPRAAEAITGRVRDICLSMSAEDYLSMPPVFVNDVFVDLLPEERKAYDSFAKSCILELEGEEEITAASAATLAGRLRQFVSGALYCDEGRRWRETTRAKMERFLEIVEGSTSPLLVGYDYRHELERMEKNAGVEVCDTPETIRRWNRGEIPVMAGHPQSMGHGLNIQSGGHTIVWYTLPWSLESYEQFNARLYRQGQSHPVIIHRLIVRGTIDEEVAKALSKKTGTQRAIMDAVKAECERLSP